MTKYDAPDNARKPHTVMVVEDEVLIAIDLKLQIEALGFKVAGPFHKVETSLAYLETEFPDMAVLDFNLNRKETSKAIAERLVGQKIPVTFLSGYAATDLIEQSGIGSVEVLSKPVTQIGLKTALERMAQTAVGNYTSQKDSIGTL